MNTATQRENMKKLIEYQIATPGSGSRLNLDIGMSYMDVLNRIAILQGTSKTQVIKDALDRIVEAYGEQILFPEVG